MQFGFPIRKYGAIREKVSTMMSKTFVSESLMYRAGQEIEDRVNEIGTVNATKEYAIECAIAKIHGSETLDYVVDEAVQCNGGMGYSAEYPIERAYRDSRIARIYEGTNEINRLMLVAQYFKKIKNKDINITSNVIKGYSKILTPLFMSKTDKICLVDNHKKLLGILTQLVYSKFGKNLHRHQHVMIWLSDIIIEIYANESALLRSEKTQDTHQKLMIQKYLYDSNKLIKNIAENIISSICKGIKRHLLNRLVNKLTSQKNHNPEIISLNVY